MLNTVPKYLGGNQKIIITTDGAEQEFYHVTNEQKIKAYKITTLATIISAVLGRTLLENSRMRTKEI